MSQPRTASRLWILYAAWGCALASLLHIVTIIAGPDWFDFLGAPPEYGQMMRDGDWVFPVAVTLGIAAILAIWSAYAFGAAGAIKRLPLTRIICWAVAAIFLLRGAGGIPLMIFVMLQTGFTALTAFHLAASVYILSLGVGFVFAARARR
ncbi:hypothetical protein [Fretibacter rubidus]|uniref:hypothetical protein n=1 Tax=Fretibacter rubidus TaxID=570162 RepID=UPI00352A22C2